MYNKKLLTVKEILLFFFAQAGKFQAYSELIKIFFFGLLTQKGIYMKEIISNFLIAFIAVSLFLLITGYLG